MQDLPARYNSEILGSVKIVATFLRSKKNRCYISKIFWIQKSESWALSKNFEALSKIFPPLSKIFDDVLFSETKTITKQRKCVQKQRKYPKFSPAAGFQFLRILLNTVFSTIKLKPKNSPEGRKNWSKKSPEGRKKIDIGKSKKTPAEEGYSWTVAGTRKTQPG